MYRISRPFAISRHLAPALAFPDVLAGEDPFSDPHGSDRGAATAEYAIALLAAAGFAGVLVTLLTSDTARGWLTSIIEKALAL
jgi:hypothetical protein